MEDIIGVNVIDIEEVAEIDLDIDEVTEIDLDIEEVAEIKVEVEQIGPRGLSAYEVYVKNGGTLSEEEWLESLQGSNGVIVLAEDDDETKIEKLLSVIEDGMVVRPLFYRTYNSGDEIPGIYELLQSYVYDSGRAFIFKCLFSNVYMVRFTVSSDNTLTKEASKILWSDFVGTKEITGELENLSTEDKSNLVNAINEVRESAAKNIEVSSTEPKNKEVMLWYEIASDVDLNEFYLEYNENDLIMNYQDDLSLDFNVVNNELIVTNDVSELDFNINENKELEVSYGN